MGSRWRPPGTPPTNHRWHNRAMDDVTRRHWQQVADRCLDRAYLPVLRLVTPSRPTAKSQVDGRRGGSHGRGLWGATPAALPMPRAWPKGATPVALGRPHPWHGLPHRCGLRHCHRLAAQIRPVLPDIHVRPGRVAPLPRNWHP